jgi:hypothetical protein
MRLEVMEVLGMSSHQLHATATYNQYKTTKYTLNRRLDEPQAQGPPNILRKKKVNLV